MFVHHNTEGPRTSSGAGARNRTAVGGRTMISDMSWLISAWKAKVSTSSSAIVLVQVLGCHHGSLALEGTLCSSSSFCSLCVGSTGTPFSPSATRTLPPGCGLGVACAAGCGAGGCTGAALRLAHGSARRLTLAHFCVIIAPQRRVQRIKLGSLLSANPTEAV